MKTLIVSGLGLAALCLAAGDAAWPWSGHQDAKAVTLLLLGDVKMIEKVRGLSGNVDLKVDGKEVVLIGNAI